MVKGNVGKDLFFVAELIIRGAAMGGPGDF
jgi:hypothetical protein